jgi:hypothetical protein
MGDAQRLGFAQSLKKQLRAAHVMEGWLPSVEKNDIGPDLRGVVECRTGGVKCTVLDLM